MSSTSISSTSTGPARGWRADPVSAATTAAGSLLLTLGFLAISRAGFEPPLAQPVVMVFGFTHTAMLGLVEAFAGALLAVAGWSRARNGAMVVAFVLAAGGAVAATQAESLRSQLAVEQRFGWLVSMVAMLVLAANLFVSDVQEPVPAETR
jgi:hypothetical protein